MAARPATPIQLARACLRAGFDFVAPISWGEELLAMSVLKAVQAAPPSAAIVVHCPFVAEALRAEATALPPCYVGVAPPVATARYVREAFKPRPVSITYAGRCPGAAAPDIDASILPDILLGQLVEAGVVPVEQPRYFDELLPPDRSRYASLPGGVPHPALLMATTGASLREAAPTTLASVAAGPDASDSIIIDLESSCGCVCGRDRFAVALLEPPRSTEPVVSAGIIVNLADDRVNHLAREFSSRPMLHGHKKESVAEVPTPSNETVDVAVDHSPKGIVDGPMAKRWTFGAESRRPEATASAPTTGPVAVVRSKEDVEASPSANMVVDAPPPRENEVVGVEPASASEPRLEPEVDWFDERESDAAAFPEPEPYQTSISTAANPEPLISSQFEEPLFEESIFEASLFEGMGIGPKPSSSTRGVNTELQTALGDDVRAYRADIAEVRAVFSDGPEATDEPTAAERQLTSTVEPWVRPAKTTKQLEPLHVDLSQLDHVDEATPPAASDDVSEASGAHQDPAGPASASVEGAGAGSEAPVEALSHGLHPTGLADATAYPTAEWRDTPREPRRSDESAARGPRMRHAALVVALGGLALASSLLAASLSGWFGGYSEGPGPDSTPPILPAYEVTRPPEVMATDTSLTRRDSVRKADDSNHALRLAPHEARPSME